MRPFKPSARSAPKYSEVEENGPIPLVQRTGEVLAPELWVGWRVPNILDPARQVADVWTVLLRENLKVAQLDDEDVTSLECFGIPMELGSHIGCRLGLASAVHPAGTATGLKNALRDLGANLADRLPRTRRTI